MPATGHRKKPYRIATVLEPDMDMDNPVNGKKPVNPVNCVDRQCNALH